MTGNCALGRAVGNDVVLVDDRVSRRHATIHAQGGNEFWLVDLGSRNGTYLNGRRVSQPSLLRDRDVIQIGPFALTFHFTHSLRPSPDDAWAADQTQADLRSLLCWLLVCDITGSSRLAQECRPAELAVLVGGWFAHCKEVIEDNGGSINKYLGDGLLAYWPAREEALAHVVQSLRDLRRLQEERHPPFRVVIHHGPVLLGGIPSSGEESLAGSEVNLVFRAEKLAGRLQAERLASHGAAAQLRPHLTFTPAGGHTLTGFDGAFEFYTF